MLICEPMLVIRYVVFSPNGSNRQLTLRFDNFHRTHDQSDNRRVPSVSPEDPVWICVTKL